MRSLPSTFMRAQMIEFIGLVGSKMRGAGRPTFPSLGEMPHACVSAKATSFRKSRLACSPPGRWHDEQFACRYERTRCSTVAPAGGVPTELAYGVTSAALYGVAGGVSNRPMAWNL